MANVVDLRHVLKNNPELYERVKCSIGNIDKLFKGSCYLFRQGLYRKFEQNGESQERYLGNFVIVPLSEITKDNGLDVQKDFTFKCIMWDGRELSEVTIPADKFYSMNWIVPAWGLLPRAAPGQNTLAYIRDSIQAISEGIPNQHIYTHTGWRKINGVWVYLYHGGAVGMDDVSVELEGNLMNYNLPDATENYKEAAINSLNTLDIAPHEIMMPLLATVYLSPLNEFFREVGIEPAYVLFLLGQTGLMKSTLAALMLSHFGEFSGKNLPGSFKDTSNSLEKKGFLLKDTLTVIDDYHPITTRAEGLKMESTAQAITRAYGDRTGRNRMNSDTTLKQAYVPRGNLIITGEDIPNIGQSGTARHLTLELKKGDIDTQKLTQAQDNTKMLSLSMRGYIEWLIPRISGLSKYLKDQFVELRTAASRDGQHNRLPETIAWIQVGFVTMLNYFKDTGAINEMDFNTLAAESWTILLKLAENQSRRIAEDKPTAKFLNALREMLATNSSYVIPTDSTSLSPGTSSGFIGYSDGIYYYLYPETVYREVVRFYQSQGETFPVSKVTLLKHLDIENHIYVEHTGSETVRTPSKRINGSRKERFIWLNKNSIKLE